MNKIAKLAVAATLGVSGAAFAAEGVSHTFIEAGYGYGEVAGGAGETDGFKLAASYELPANVIVDASWSRSDYDFLSTKVSEISAGLKYKLPLTSSTDLLLGASYEALDVNAAGSTLDGFGLGVGARARATDKLQFEAALKYFDVEKLPSTFVVSLAGRYLFTPAFSAGLDLQKHEYLLAGETRFTAMFRYSFGAR